MATKAKSPARSGRAGKARGKLDDLPDLINHRLVADKLGIAPDSLRDWIEDGHFPEPHSFVKQTMFYRVDLVRAYLETGKWPDGTRFRRQR